MFKSKVQDNNAVASAALDQRAQTTRSTPVSCIGSGMSIVGNVECEGPAQVFGRIDGELRATELVIGEGGEIEGSIMAQEVTVNGRVKGTIRAARVRLQGGTVEGDIFHRTLSIDESSVFEGMSRRMENSIEREAESAAESSGAAKAAQEKSLRSPSVVPSALPSANGASRGHSETSASGGSILM
jgi:cytoskeletal protein CcmA (bactofilin family)